MNLIRKLRKRNLPGKLLTYVLILLSSIFIIFFSFNIDIPHSSVPSYFWFSHISQVFYIILIVYSLANIIKIFYLYRNVSNIKERNDELKKLNQVTVTPQSRYYLTNNFIKNNIIVEEHTLKDDIINNSVEKESIVNSDYDLTFKEIINQYLPLPMVITNKDGKIIQCNSLAKKFFQSSLVNKDINDFIEPLDSNILNGFTIVNAIVFQEDKKNIVSSIFQTSIFKQNKVLSYVILLFLPCPVNNQDMVDLNTKSVYSDKDIIVNGNDNLCGITNLSTSILENFGNYLNCGILILNKDNNIICVNNKAVDLLSNNLFVTYNKLTNRSDIIHKHFTEIFYTTLKNDQISSLLNNNIAKIQLNVKNSFFLEVYSQKVDENRIITLVDISEKRRLELQNNFSQRLQTIGQIASAVAHDFNNLLTAIMSFTYFLKERYTAEDPSTLELEQIEQNANRAKVMIRQLLTFSRSKDLNPVTFAVNSEISNLMSTILRLMGERIKTDFIRGKNIGEITMDPIQFQQVIINLVVNARDAMKNRGHLIISTEKVSLKQPKEAVIVTIPSGDYVVINIKDEGEGIEKTNFKKIFQTHFSTKGDKGNGLGLSTVAKIMQDNSGYIYLESSLSKGSVFSLYFPTEHKLDDKKEIENVDNSIVKLNNLSEDIAIDLTGNETILLVEDEIPVRTVCKRALVSKGYKVIEAEDAEYGLSILQNSANKVDLIISDVMMPGLSGLEFVSEARKLNPNVKAILMSGYTEDTLEDNHYTLDSIEFLAKPFNPDVLTTKVKKVINN